MIQPPRFNDLAMLLSDPPFPNEDLWRELIAQNPARAWRRYCWLVRQSWEGTAQEQQRWAAIRAFQRSTGRNSDRFADDARRRINPGLLWSDRQYQAGDPGWNPQGSAKNDSQSWHSTVNGLFSDIAVRSMITREQYRSIWSERQRRLDYWRWKLHWPPQRAQKYLASYQHLGLLLAIALEEAQRPPLEVPEQQNGANLGPYPDWDEWRRVVAAGRQASRDMLGDLELRAAKFGLLHMPFNLQESLSIGRQLMDEHF